MESNSVFLTTQQRSKLLCYSAIIQLKLRKEEWRWTIEHDRRI